MEVIRCGVHAFHEVLGIDRDEIRFFWVLDSAVEKARQTAYRLTLSLSPQGGDNSDLLWDTGKVESNEQRNIICKPEGGFRSTTFHYWQVTVWDQDGKSTVSGPNEFFTAYPRSSRLLPPYSMNQTYVSGTQGPISTNYTIVRSTGLTNESTDAALEPHLSHMVRGRT